MLRTNTCGELTKKQVGKKVTLCGWVNSRRDHGGIIFIDLRDRYGLTQIKFDPKISQEAWNEADKVRPEWVLKVSGKILARPKDMINKNLATGEVEVAITEIEVLNEAKTPPFEIWWGQEKSRGGDGGLGRGYPTSPPWPEAGGLGRMLGRPLTMATFGPRYWPIV